MFNRTTSDRGLTFKAWLRLMLVAIIAAAFAAIVASTLVGVSAAHGWLTLAIVMLAFALIFGGVTFYFGAKLAAEVRE